MRPSGFLYLSLVATLLAPAAGWSGAVRPNSGRRVPVAEPAVEDDPATPQIVNGQWTNDFPSTVAIVHPPADRPYPSGGLECTGTLIGCSTVVTAAHCFCGATPTSDCEIDTTVAGPFDVYLQHAGRFGVSSVWVHPDYSGGPDFLNDVAVVSLASPVTGVTPMPINTSGTPPSGTSGIIVGFGRKGGSSNDFGIKRYGMVSVNSGCSVGPSQLCWLFSDPPGPAGTDSSTCQGDSGGPLYTSDGSGPVVSGITSYGLDGVTCYAPAIDTNVYYFQTLIASAAGADLGGPACGSVAAFGEPGTGQVGTDDVIDFLGDQDVFPVSVPAGIKSLRFGLNATEQDVLGLYPDFDLYVRAGAAPTLATFDCRSAGYTQYEYCEIPNPAPGTWYALVDGYAGVGEYQLTVTGLPPEPVGPLDFYSIPPCRSVDTRIDLGPGGGAPEKLHANVDRDLPIAGTCGVPADARAVSGVLSVVNPSNAGYLTLYPADEGRPFVSAINFLAGGVTNNNTFVKLSSDGAGALRAYNPTAELDFIFDVNGYFK